jgi:hypothetical protein
MPEGWTHDDRQRLARIENLLKKLVDLLTNPPPASKETA